MEWDNDKCLQLIESYKTKPEIWQAAHKFYYNKTKKQDAWNEIAKDMNTTVDVVKAKLNSLLSSFRREKAKLENSMRTCSDPDEVYQSRWFGYEAFQFLMEKSKRRKTHNKAKLNAEEEAAKDNDVDLDELQSLQIPTEDETSEDTDDSDTRETVAQQYVRSKRKKRKLDGKYDTRFHKHFNILQQGAERDGCAIYGEHVATKLRTYSQRTQALVQHLFNNILFNADMGQYDSGNVNFTNTVPNIHLLSHSTPTIPPS